MHPALAAQQAAFVISAASGVVIGATPAFIRRIGPVVGRRWRDAFPQIDPEVASSLIAIAQARHGPFEYRGACAFPGVAGYVIEARRDAGELQIHVTIIDEALGADALTGEAEQAVLLELEAEVARAVARAHARLGALSAPGEALERLHA